MLAVLPISMDVPPSFQFAKETTTQLITLATAVVGVSITFAKDIRTGVSTKNSKLLFASWIAFLISICGGVWTLMALTGTLTKEPIAAAAIYNSNITIPAVIQVIAFLVGILFLIIDAAKR